MSLTTFDWIIIGVYLLATLVLGIWFARRGTGSFLDFVLSGRRLPWWLAGTSLVATTFSVDTPIYVTELVREDGIAGNWQWWSFGIGGAMGILGALFFARRWRRAGIVTEVEFVEVRYGKEAAFLRGFKAVYFALVKNTLGIAALLAAMASIFRTTLGIDFEEALYATAGIALIYTLASGLWGVVLADFFQFLLGMAGSIALAIYALDAAGGMEAIRSTLESRNQASWMEFLPSGEGNLSFLVFGVYLGFLWWANPNADGGGMFVQRMAACKNENHAIAGSLWAVFAHYVLRTWPWILAALASMVLLSSAKGGEAYGLLISNYLPAGWRGVMVVAFLAAFMSTMSTLLNWGASVLINDLYRRFVRPEAGEKHLVRATQAATVLLLLVPMLLISETTRVRGVVETILSLGAGFGPVLIARWIWWRVTVWSEISAFAMTLVAGAVMLVFPEAVRTIGEGFGEEGSMALFLGKLTLAAVGSALVWVPVTLLTSPAPRDVLEEFTRRVEPVGWWGGIAGARPWRTFREARVWLLGVAFLYASLFGVGHLCLQNWTQALGNLAVALVCGLLLRGLLQRSKTP